MKIPYTRIEAGETDIPTHQIVKRIRDEYLAKLGGEFVREVGGKYMLMEETRTSHRFEFDVRELTEEEVANFQVINRLIVFFMK
ncbi:MAG: hypothetical protein A3B99_03885 [Candidatus Yanofskybacteria bacterium RIFCSPHIGHO2_02_FULL_44_12b]|uniref:Uncharacterized protein n=1 Tax=Candidatus Yanofskybacteria bacterium RIFCSPLOWO2_01_FULL_44_22 TaxID=1802697 RepID=A0A1F8GPY3_9BACT|nr:MAG: hypothetical protein A2659_00955 [Candidatus Yanofskybacteria bacterium RIFCSPHIGHO2_01_FULL_44_24]OGN15660.1 MAG: hypothetical protein A3B99_03885 [Candidatus Yanofskybacteria bacterium RIFCSPHIGHO2_02_FULL_44_12b]OGN26716.1 MAG: hypothetical protein A2925_03970 [Candidatus Yanofskybacteria bacterium RIFCSPLOWO2_01_FULL_44_22]